MKVYFGRQLPPFSKNNQYIFLSRVLLDRFQLNAVLWTQLTILFRYSGTCAAHLLYTFRRQRGPKPDVHSEKGLFETHYTLSKREGPPKLGSLGNTWKNGTHLVCDSVGSGTWRTIFFMLKTRHENNNKKSVMNTYFFYN